VAVVVCRDAAEAEDAAQEGFLKAYRALGRFRQGAPFRPWLLRIVANEARNRRRAAGRRARLELRLGAAGAASGDAAPSPEAVLVDAERSARLLAAIERLGEADRAVLTCRYLLDLSEHETARTLRLRTGTVKSRTSRALARLRDEVEARPA
jgi:RNA polymerase sigma-70 factor (ECF subfamily)